MQMQAGNYLGTLVKGIPSETQNGSPQVALVFNITHAGVDGQWQDLGEATERTVYLSLNGGAKPYTLKKLESLGRKPGVDTTGDEPCLTFDPEIAGKPIELKCEFTTYNEKTKESWDLASWGGGPKAAGDEALMKIAALLDG